MSNKVQLSADDPRVVTFSYIFLLSILVIIAYIITLPYAFISDDIYGIVNNPNIARFDNVLSQPFKFLQPLIYFMVYHITGLNPVLYRLINIIFHIGSVSMVFLLTRRLTNQTTGFITAALFAVHPILVESITWISGGTYAWYTFFFLASLECWIRSRTISTPHHKPSHFKKKQNTDESRITLHAPLYILSIVMFLLSVISGIPAITLSVVIVLYEYLFGNIKKTWLYLAPFIILSAVYAVLALLGIGSRVSSFETNFYQQQGVPHNPLVQIPVAISSYLQLIFWPAGLTLYHSEFSLSTGQYLVHVTIFLIFIGLLIYSFFRNKIVCFGLSLFLISLIPTLTPYGFTWLIAERYVYCGTIGIIFIISYLLGKILKNEDLKPMMYLVVTLLILGLTVRTLVRNNDWKNEDNLWIATAKTSPSDPKTHNNLGDVYGRRGDLQRSAEEFKKAIQLNPNYADAYHNLANTYQQMGSPSAALQSYEKATELNPNLWQSYQNIAAIYFQNKDYEKAISYMQKTVDILPQNPNLHANLGIIYLESGDAANAEIAFRTALQLDPQNQTALVGLQQVSKEE